MTTNSTELEFVNFSPGKRLDNFIERLSEKLYEQAPSDSVMKIAVRASRGAIRATCRIVSHAGIFVGEAMTENPVQALRELEKKMTRQLATWKKHRFEKRQK